MIDGWRYFGYALPEGVTDAEMARRRTEVFLEVLKGEGFAQPNPNPMFPNPPGLLRVEARPQQWVWEFRYPGVEGATTGTLHLPAGRPVDVAVIGTDVIHSFWVPRLGGKIDAIPGHVNVIRLSADRPGTYGGVCAEFCGTGHADMAFTVIAHPPETYAPALAEALEPLSAIRETAP